MNEAWEEEQMSNLGCESVSDLIAEVKRLREAISDIARSMDAADPVYLQGFIKDLYEVIE